MISIAKFISTKNLPNVSGKASANNDVALGASLQEQKNRVLGESSASTSTSSVLGKSGYKKDRQNLSGIILG